MLTAEKAAKKTRKQLHFLDTKIKKKKTKKEIREINRQIRLNIKEGSSHFSIMIQTSVFEGVNAYFSSRGFKITPYQKYQESYFINIAVDW